MGLLILLGAAALLPLLIPDPNRKKKKWEEARERRDQELDLLAKYIRIMNSR